MSSVDSAGQGWRLTPQPGAGPDPTAHKGGFLLYPVEPEAEFGPPVDYSLATAAPAAALAPAWDAPDPPRPSTSTTRGSTSTPRGSATTQRPTPGTRRPASTIRYPRSYAEAVAQAALRPRLSRRERRRAARLATRALVRQARQAHKARSRRQRGGLFRRLLRALFARS